MTNSNTALMAAELKRDEGLRLLVYDDATGLAIKPGSAVRGHPTIGVGRALDVRGLSGIEADYLLYQDIAAISNELRQAYGWFAGLSDVRRRVLVNMAFNLGAAGLAGFKVMLAAIRDKDYVAAGSAMEASAWFVQVGQRGVRLRDAMVSGVSQ